MRKILVIGGGIAGVETALTLARCLPNDDVTLAASWPSLRLLPNLVYVPFGVSPRRIDIDLTEQLEQHGVTFVQATCEAVQAQDKIAVLDGDEFSYDVLVAAPGAVSNDLESSAMQLRNLADAMDIREHLEGIDAHDRRSFIVRVLADTPWSVPGIEFTCLLATWRQAMGLKDLEVAVATNDSHCLAVFNLEASEAVQERLVSLGVDVMTDVPAGRIESLDGDLKLDIAYLEARRIRGLPGLGGSGFYETDDDGKVADDIYIVGDARKFFFKSAFAAAWQARVIADKIGGDLSLLSDDIGGVPANMCEYQMDMGEQTLVARFDARTHFSAQYVDERADISVIDAPADKLNGLLTRELLIDDTVHEMTGQPFRDVIDALQPHG